MGAIMSDNIIENEKIIQITNVDEFMWGLGEYGNLYVIKLNDSLVKWELYIQSPKYKQE